MSLPTVKLSGSALRGVDSRFSSRASFAALPQTVKLGAVISRTKRPMLQFGNYLSLSPKVLRALPPSTDRRSKAQKSLSRMYCNDRLGCCVFSGKAHNLGLWSANDSDSGGEVQATDAEVQSQYFDYTGGQDSGANIAEVLDLFTHKGYKAGGKFYKLDGYVAVNHTSQALVQAANFIFGSTSIGIDLPGDWTQNAVWDVTNSQIVGGHDVSPVDYGPDGVYVSSWGRIYLITWRAFMSQKWIQEMYAGLAQLWYGNDRLAPSGVDVAALNTDLKKIGQGQVPDITPPTPPVPPGPNPPPSPGPNTWVIRQTVPVMVAVAGNGTRPSTISVTVPVRPQPVTN